MANLTRCDAGVIINVQIGEDISDATDVKITFQNPSYVSKTVNATIKDGTNDTVEYTTEENDFDVSGKWRGQVTVIQPSLIRRSSIFTITVEETLESYTQSFGFAAGLSMVWAQGLET